jgi:hypothetical protein
MNQSGHYPPVSPSTTYTHPEIPTPLERSCVLHKYIRVAHLSQPWSLCQRVRSNPYSYVRFLLLSNVSESHNFHRHAAINVAPEGIAASSVSHDDLVCGLNAARPKNVGGGGAME